MAERDWPGGEATDERTPEAPGEGDRVEGGRTAGGADPLTGERGEPESSNADVPAAE